MYNFAKFQGNSNNTLEKIHSKEETFKRLRDQRDQQCTEYVLQKKRLNVLFLPRFLDFTTSRIRNLSFLFYIRKTRFHIFFLSLAHTYTLPAIFFMLYICGDFIPGSSCAHNCSSTPIPSKMGGENRKCKCKKTHGSRQRQFNT